MTPLRFLLAACAFAALALPSAAIAQVESTPIPGPPKPDFSSMAYMLGTWSCSTKSERRPAAYTSRTTYSMSRDGWWIEGVTVTDPMPWFSTKIKTTNYDHITYDANANRWVDLYHADNGGYDLLTSPGWKGNTIAWHSMAFPLSAEVPAIDDTVVTKLSDTSQTARWGFTEKSGRKVAVVTTCSKSG